MTKKSANRKTGNMAQVWILCEDGDPVDCLTDGTDRAICGDCPHRPNGMNQRSCYVNVGQAPLSVYRAWRKGVYPVYNALEHEEQVRPLKIRWGAYGDPGVLPANLVDYFNGLATGWTGYTHQWRNMPWYRGVFMASCDGLTDYVEASSNGWKCFTVVKKGVNITYSKQCPATVENSQAQCDTCALCNGSRADIYVHAHGRGARYVTAA